MNEGIRDDLGYSHTVFVFDSLTRTNRKIPSFGNRTTLVALYVFDSLKRTGP